MPHISRSPVRPSHPISRLVSVAATLLSVPGLVAYVLCIAWLFYGQVDLGLNVVAPLLLAASGLGLILLAVSGIVAGLCHRFLHGKVDPVIRLCFWLNGLVIAGMMALAIFTPQLQ